MPLLSALAAAIGNTRRIALKRLWSEPAIVWTAIIGASGTLKSPAIDLALRPVRRRQAEAFEDYEQAKYKAIYLTRPASMSPAERHRRAWRAALTGTSCKTQGHWPNPHVGLLHTVQIGNVQAPAKGAGNWRERSAGIIRVCRRKKKPL